MNFRLLSNFQTYPTDLTTPLSTDFRSAETRLAHGKAALIDFNACAAIVGV
jgi:hypothetical protein